MYILEPGLEVVIMAHERQMETLRALRALQKVDFGMPTIVRVSDNPSTPAKAIVGLPKEVRHTVRNPGGSAIWHFNEILGELKCSWTLITHDDDEILPALGDCFRQYSADPRVSVITGLSTIVDKSGTAIDNESYQTRLLSSGLLGKEIVPRADLFNQLFDLGSLFPASAMLVRTSVLMEMSEVKEEFNLASDLAISLHVAASGMVIFEGRRPVMNYHLHGGNSVFSSSAAGGLMADLTVTKLSFLISMPELVNQKRKWMLTKASIIAKVLANSFEFDERYRSVTRYVRLANDATNGQAVYWFARLPMRAGLMRPIVRRLMRKRLGLSNHEK